MALDWSDDSDSSDSIADAHDMSLSTDDSDAQDDEDVYNFRSDDELQEMSNMEVLVTGCVLLKVKQKKGRTFTRWILHNLKMLGLVWSIQPDTSQVWMWLYLGLMLAFALWNSKFRSEWFTLCLTQVLLYSCMHKLICALTIQCFMLPYIHTFTEIIQGWKRKWLFSYTVTVMIEEIKTFDIVPETLAIIDNRKHIKNNSEPTAELRNGSYQCNLLEASKADST